MGFLATQWAMRVDGLDDKAHWVLARIAWSALDEDGLLDKSPNWLADKCHMSERGLRRYVLLLEQLHLIRRESRGYLLTGFLESNGQNRPLLAPLERPNERPKMAIPLKPPIRKESIECLEYLEIRGGEPTPRSFKEKSRKSENRERHAKLWTALVDYMTSDQPMPAWCEKGTPDYELMRQGFDQVGGKFRFRGWEKRPQDASFARDEFLEYLAIHDQEVKA